MNNQTQKRSSAYLNTSRFSSRLLSLSSQYIPRNFIAVSPVHLSASMTKRQREDRKRALKMLNDGELNIIFATYQLAKEGLDVPNLRYVVFATPEQDETTVIQSAGRVGRKADGKRYGTVIDFCDDFGLYRKWRKKRESCYKKIGAKILKSIDTQ